MSQQKLHPDEIACREAFVHEDGYGTPATDHRYLTFRDGFYAGFYANRAQRDELLEALAGMVEVFGDEFGMGDSEAVDRARAIIAKAEGGAS